MSNFVAFKKSFILLSFSIDGTVISITPISEIKNSGASLPVVWGNLLRVTAIVVAPNRR